MSGNTTSAPTPPQVINFDEIPFDIQVPGTYAEIHANYSQAGLFSYPARALIIAPMQASGTAAPNQPYPLSSDGAAAVLFGTNSIARQMTSAFITANPWTQLDVIGVPDAGAGTKAQLNFTLTGTATAPGTLAFYVMGVGTYVPVNAGDTATVIVQNLVAAYLANPATAALPVTGAAMSAPGVFYLIAAHAGTLANEIDIRLNYNPTDVTPPGITGAFTFSSQGAVDPAITAALNAIATVHYTDIVMAWSAPGNANIPLLEAALATRYTAMGKLDAFAYGCVAGTPGLIQSGQAAYNSKFRSVLGVQNPVNPPWVIAAAFAGVAAYNLANDPSRQLRDLALPGILAPAPADRFTEAERQILLSAGISTFTVQVDGTVTLERVVTEYLTSATGVADPAWHDIMVPRTMSRIRYDWVGYVSLTYPRNKLADDGTIAAEYDQTVVTPSRLHGSWAGRCRTYAELGWIENTRNTVKQSLFVRDLNDRNRVNARLQVQMIGNLMVEAVSLEFLA